MGDGVEFGETQYVDKDDKMNAADLLELMRVRSKNWDDLTEEEQKVIQEEISERYQRKSREHLAKGSVVSQESGENVNHPKHYMAESGVEVIDALEAWGCGFNDGNVIKYVARYKKKGGVEDLKKARWYLDRLITNEMDNMQ